MGSFQIIAPLMETPKDHPRLVLLFQLSTGSNNLGSNPQDQNEDHRKEEGTSCPFSDDHITIQFDKCERMGILLQEKYFET